MDRAIKAEPGDRKKALIALGPPKLNTLSPEVLGNIAAHLERPSHLSNLTKTCKEIRAVIQPRLYENLTLTIPEVWSSVIFLEHLVDPQADGVRFTRAISVSSQNAKVDLTSDSDDINDDGLFMDAWRHEKDFFGQRYFQPRVLNAMIRLIITKIPKDQLRAFHWRHTNKLSNLTTGLIFKNHSKSLADLRIYNTSEDLLHDCTNLVTLHFPDIAPESSTRLLAQFLVGNRKSLVNLKLGRERSIAMGELNPKKLPKLTPNLVEEIRKSHAKLAGQLDRIDQNMQTADTIFQVKALHLIGFNVLDLSFGQRPYLFDLAQLSYLTLESSYPGNDVNCLLSCAGSSRYPTWIPRLRGFTLRYKGNILEIQTALESFSKAFSGLEYLSVLLEGTGLLIWPDCFVANHGSSLQYLVWDQRTGARTALDVATHAAFQDNSPAIDLNLFTKGFPELKELGLVMATRVNGSRHSYKGLDQLAGLKKLRTLNIRNLPTIQSIQRADKSEIAWVHRCEALALNATKDFLHGWTGDQEHPLHTIAFGATTHVDIWKRRAKWIEGNRLDFWLCPRIYHVEHHVNIKGERQPVITLIAQGTAKEAEEHTSDLHIFEPYWMD